MPKKKEKKSVEKPDEDKKTKKSSASPPEKTASDDREKDLYLIQLRYLNEQLERYQLKCDEHERQRKDFDSRYSALEKEKTDIAQYLKRSLLEKEDEVDELAETLEAQRQAADKGRDALLLQHRQQRQELQERNDELTEENMALVAKLADLEEFQKQKELLMSNMESLQKQLSSQETEHKVAIHSLEMKALLEKKRLEKEMEDHRAAMAAEVQDLVDQKVPETTRLAVQENREVKARFCQLSEQAQVLVVENAALRDRKNQLCVDVDILEQTLSGISRKSCIRKKVVEQLTEKCQQLQAKLNDSRQEVEQLQTEHGGVVAQLEALRQEQASAIEQRRENRAEVSRLEAKLQDERKRRSRTRSIVQEAAVTLRQALMEDASEQDSVVRWRQLLQKLLAVLDGAPPLGDDFSPTSSAAENQQAKRLQASDPAAARNKAEAVDAALRPADLSQVPSPAPIHKPPTVTTTGTGSSSTRLPLHRKPCGQKTSRSVNLNQTDSAVRLSRNSFTKPKV